MNNIKNILNTVAVALACTTLFSACNDKEFLEEHSYSNDSAGFYQSERSMEIGLASCYSEVQYLIFGNLRQPHSWMLLGLGCDTFANSSATNECSNWEAMTEDSGQARHWPDFLYKLVNRANTVVDKIDEGESISYSTPTRKNELRAEAVFLRSWAYRCLAGMYGGAVYTEHMTTEARYDYELLTREEVWAKLKADFAWCEQNLPTKPRLMGTITKAAAAHYLAEVCLALGDFKEAEEAASRVINGTDGNYALMTTRFGNRKDQSVDRYGNSLAAPQGAYWDLFRSSAKTDGSVATDSNANDPTNTESIWVAQIDFSAETDNYPLGGSGDSWWRCHMPPTEGCFAPYIPRGGKNGTRVDKNGVKFYIFTADAVCFPEGATTSDPRYKNGGTPASDIPEAKGRLLAWNAWQAKCDSLATRVAGVNSGPCDLNTYATEWMTRKAGDPLGSVWDDPNDFRGSEVMIQRDYYTPSGKLWSEVKKAIEARAAAHPDDNSYKLTAGDTVNVTPRFWKFSDDKHPFQDKANSNIYDADWYMIRIAETYLLRAEARLAQNNKSGAAEDINVIRNRAGAKSCSAADVDIDYIMDERARELFGEEQRWITLNRLSCNPKATYVTSKYPTQDTSTSNYMYERVHKYGFGYENAPGTREAYKDIYGVTRHRSNFKPHNYVLPIPAQIIQSNKDVKIPQNAGYSTKF
ncbi:MAG: RagB/SusD family nutrient uptake outer membrane protein [Bacteroidales bacterium]|nr:RagB/SusD family nutrient uptake outer membrane protein [Candidatus Cryptobacteroides onthequi]